MAAESSMDIEDYIQEAIEKISRNEKPNIAATARNLRLPGHRLQARLKRCQSRHQHLASNWKLSPDQELALCQYLNCLDEIGLPARC